LLNTLVALYAIIGGILFVIIQSSKLFHPEKAEQEMLTKPMGLLEWGYVWADTLVPAPFLLLGGILLFLLSGACRRIGGLLVFAGFALNLYAMIILWTGLPKIGQTMPPYLFWINVVLTLLGVLGMIFLALRNGGIDKKS